MSEEEYKLSTARCLGVGLSLTNEIKHRVKSKTVHRQRFKKSVNVMLVPRPLEMGLLQT